MPLQFQFLLLLLLLLLLLSIKPISSSCPDPTTHQPICPPFSTPPPYPFSLSPGCNHPFFQLKCASNSRATILINNTTFTLLNYEPNSTSLTLTPNPLTLTRPISLTGSPFKISDSTCSRISVLKPCNAPNCSTRAFKCDLVKNPLLLLPECGGAWSTRHDEEFGQECQSDVISVLDSILRIGIEVEFELDEKDSFFNDCKLCKDDKNGVCGFNVSDVDKSFVCFKLLESRVRREGTNLVAIGSALLVLLCLFVVLSVGSFLFRRNRKALVDVEEDPTSVFLRRHRSASLLPPVFTYDELDFSTNGFDSKRKIGDGGFGSVYLGQLKDGKFVAVKHLHKTNSTGVEKGFSNKSFCNEILILSSIEHPNLVKLHGYCSDPRGLLLVYDYVPNGTLADHLHGKHNLFRKMALSWSTRVDIALQIALAIEYLHFAVLPPIVHRDITSSNIFVEKDMRVKVGDFGLSRLLVCSEMAIAVNDSSQGVWTGPQGTPGYLDPDYYRSFRLNEKSDVYSFGVVLLELITGKRAVDQKREKRELTLVDMVVPRIQMGLLNQVVDPFLLVDREAKEGASAVAEIAFRCLAADKDDRPDAREVVEELRRIKGNRRGIGMLKSSNSGNMVVPDGV